MYIFYIHLILAAQVLAVILQFFLTWRSHRMRLTCLGLTVFVLVFYNQRWEVIMLL